MDEPSIPSAKKKITKAKEFPCKCSKVYYSESALLTHIKKKHEGNRKEFNPKETKNHKKTGRPKTSKNDIKQLNGIGEFDHVFVEKVENFLYTLHECLSKSILLDYTSPETDFVKLVKDWSNNPRLISIVSSLNLDNELILPTNPSVEEIFAFFLGEFGSNVSEAFLVDLVKLIDLLIRVINEKADGLIQEHGEFKEIEQKIWAEPLSSIKTSFAGNFIVEGIVPFYDFWSNETQEFVFFSNSNNLEIFLKKFASFLYECQLSTVELEQ